MQKNAVLIVLLLLVTAGVCWLVFFRGDDAAPIVPNDGDVVPLADDPAGASGGSGLAAAEATGPSTMQRTAVAVGNDDLLDDPEIREGLCGFKGRVVSFDGQPASRCGVRFYRGAMDSIVREGADVFADEPTAEPNYIAGETQTGEDGRFLLSGVWPRAIYVMFAGIGTDAPVHEIITQTPSPGEVVDLGDIVLPNAGVIVGKVLGEDGQPLAGALVRAADLPGTLAGFFPVERFDPEGAVLIREPRAPVQVVEMPPWVKGAFENVPIPTTHSGEDGTFRLVGVVPGSNLLAVTAEDHLSHMSPSVVVRAGEEKNVGEIGLSTGEELWGKVVDGDGEPVAGAEILAGSTIPIAPVDLARRVPKTNEKGEFTALGFARGNVTVAARRGPTHTWVIAEPQPIGSDVVVVLEASRHIDAMIVGADGKPVADANLRLLQGDAGDGAAEMAVFGFVPPVDIRERVSRTEEGAWRIENLNAGKYTLVARAPGHATGFAEVSIKDANVETSIQLEPFQAFQVRVVGPEERPIKNVAIYADPQGRQLYDIPLMCGRTDKGGALTIDRFKADKLRVSAEHPKWGYVHGEAVLGEELVLRMEAPGALEGVLTENGAPPEAGKYTVVVEWRRNGGPRGPLEVVPRMVTAGLDGSFRVAALQPGSYRVQTIDSLDMLKSPGGVMELMMSARMMGGGREQQRATVDVLSGQTARVQLDAGEKPIEGPTARVFGSVTVNGRLVEGAMVMGWIENRRYGEETDRAGQFDLGVVPAGNAYLTITRQGGIFGVTSTIWQGNFELKENEQRELRIEIMTSSISGTVYGMNGAPVAGGHISARGSLPDDSGSLNLHAPIDANGNFEFDEVAEGTWTFTARQRGDEPSEGKVTGVKVTGGVPVTNLRIDMRATIQVKGRLDFAMFGNEKPQWTWISVHELEPDGSLGSQEDGIGIDMGDGSFRTDDLAPGQYGLRIHAGWDGRSERYRGQNITVGPDGLDGIVITGTKEG